ncbi:hypothetical protein GEMRC1_001525 [Eukaryota sp. GEM-RC1]
MDTSKITLLLLLPLLCFSLKFELSGFDERVFLDEFPAEIFIVGDIGAPLQHEKAAPILEIDFYIEDPRGVLVYERPHLRGVSQFGFTTNLPGEYRFIISSKIVVNSIYMSAREVVFNYRIGETPETTHNLAKSEHFKPVERELLLLHDHLKSIHTTQLYLRDLTILSTEVNESTNARIPYFTLFIVCIIIATSVVQAQFLRKDLKRSKIH